MPENCSYKTYYETFYNELFTQEFDNISSMWYKNLNSTMLALDSAPIRGPFSSSDIPIQRLDFMITYCNCERLFEILSSEKGRRSLLDPLSKQTILRNLNQCTISFAYCFKVFY